MSYAKKQPKTTSIQQLKALRKSCNRSSAFKILSVDPSTKKHACALWVDKSLSDISLGYPLPCDIIVIEDQVVYPRDGAMKANALIKLAHAAGRATAHADKVHWVKPSEWKRQVPKTKGLTDYVIYQRVCEALDNAELCVLACAMQGCTKLQKFDITDAVGIGLWFLERI